MAEKSLQDLLSEQGEGAQNGVAPLPGISTKGKAVNENGAERKSYSPEEFLAKVQVGIEIVLPSGLEVKVRPVNSSALLEQDFPDELTQIVNRHTSGKPLVEEDEIKTVEDGRRLTRLVRKFNEQIAKAVVVYPKLVEPGEFTGAKGTFPIDQLPDTDLNTLQFALNVPLMHIKEFFRREAARLESVYLGKDDESSAVGGDGSGQHDASPDRALQPVSELG